MHNMDPVSIIGVVAAIQQLLLSVYSYGQGVRECKNEINALCSELLALKSPLEHIQLNFDVGFLTTDNSQDIESDELLRDAQAALSSSMISSVEFQQMLQNADDAVQEILERLSIRPGKLKSSLRKLVWPLNKVEIKRRIEHFDRLKSWFILATTTDNYAMCRESYLKICSIDMRSQRQESLQEKRATEKLQQDIRAWLAPSDPYDAHDAALNKHVKGTGSWFLDGPLVDFVENGDAKILWLAGKPGSGKTVLLSAAIEAVQDRCTMNGESCPIIFFFCCFTNHDSQEPFNILGSILIQLYDTVPELWKTVEYEYAKRKMTPHREPRRFEITILEELLLEGFKLAPKAFLFLDAINESKENETILASIKRIQTQRPVRIMISCTEEIAPDLRGLRLLVNVYGLGKGH